jgi:hypothetical protein
MTEEPSLFLRSCKSGCLSISYIEGARGHRRPHATFLCAPQRALLLASVYQKHVTRGLPWGYTYYRLVGYCLLSAFPQVDHLLSVFPFSLRSGQASKSSRMVKEFLCQVCDLITTDRQTIDIHHRSTGHRYDQRHDMSAYGPSGDGLGNSGAGTNQVKVGSGGGPSQAQGQKQVGVCLPVSAGLLVGWSA